MQKRNLKSIFKGKKPKALWGNANEKERRRYRQLLGEHRQGELSLADLIREARKYEHNNVIYFAKDFVLDKFCEKVLGKLPKKYQREDVFDLQTHSLKKSNVVYPLTSKEFQRYIKNMGRKELKKLLLEVEKAGKRTDSEMKRHQNLLYSTEALTQYPTSSASIRHGMIGRQKVIHDALETYEKIVREQLEK